MPSLTFPIQQQCGSEWCWITVAVCTDHYYDPQSAWDQGTLANALLNQTTCSITPCTSAALSSACNQPGQINHSLGYVGRLRTSVSTPILFGGIKAEIDASDPSGRPVCAGIQWEDLSIGHAVVICGYDESDGAEWVEIADPADGSIHSLPFLSFLKSYQGKGTWINTFFTQP